MTAYGRTDVQVCCISPDDLLRVDDGSREHFLFAYVCRPKISDFKISMAK